MLKYLEQIGLTNTEAVIFTWLLHYGASTLNDIAKANNIKRTTVYSAIAQLSKKGIIHVYTHGRTTLAESSGLEALRNVVNQEEDEVKKKKRSLERVMDMLAMDQDKQYINRTEHTSFNNLEHYFSQRISKIIADQKVSFGIGWAYMDNRTTIPFIEMLQDIATSQTIQIPIQILAYYGTEINEHEIKHEPPLHLKVWTGPELFPTNMVIIGSTALYAYKQAGVFIVAEIDDRVIVGQTRSLWSVLWTTKQEKTEYKNN